VVARLTPSEYVDTAFSRHGFSGMWGKGDFVEKVVTLMNAAGPGTICTPLEPGVSWSR